MNQAGQIFRVTALAAISAVLLVGCGGDSEEQETADWLQQNGYELTVSDYLLAAEAGDLEAIDLFRQRGITVDEHDADTGDTALIRAAGTGQLEAMRHLLSEGADVTIANRSERTAILVAAQEGYPEAVRLLLSHGADPKLKDQEGWNALTAAAYHGREGVVEVLAGKMSDQLDDALLVASLQGKASVVDQLLNRGAYVNTRSHADQTPLMLAAKAGHLEVVSLLMANGANPYALDRNEATAANLAKRSGHGEVADFLILPPGSSSSTALAATQELDELENADSQIDGAVLEMASLEGDLPLEGDLVMSDEPEEGGANSDAADAADAAMIDDLATSIVAEGAVDVAEAPAEEENAAASAIKTSKQGPVMEPSATVDGIAVATGDQAAPIEVASVSPSESASPQSPVSLNEATVSSAQARPAAPSAAVSSKSEATKATDQAKSPLDSMKLESYREKPLPVMLAEVEDGKAAVRVLAGPAAREAANSGADAEPVRVAEGEMIAGTPYRVSSVSSQFVSSKEGKGEMVDVSEMTVENTTTGEKHLLVKGIPGRSADTYAVVVMQPGDQRYVVHERDRFTAVNNRDQVEQFQVLEIRPTQVLIENLETRKVTTIDRGGVAMR